MIVSVLPELVEAPVKLRFLLSLGAEKHCEDEAWTSASPKVLEAVASDLSSSGVDVRTCRTECAARDSRDRVLRFAAPRDVTGGQAVLDVELIGRDRRGGWLNQTTFTVNRRGEGWGVTGERTTYAAHFS